MVALAILGAHGTSTVQITTTTRQTIHGIGASGAWWVNDFALYPESIRQNVSNLLLDQTNGKAERLPSSMELTFVAERRCVRVGLGLTDYRYNLGGGGVGVTTWDRAPETPYVR